MIEQPLAELAIALALGLLVGFQREWAEKRVAGIRTFPLITASGAFSAWLADAFGGWVFAAGLLGLVAVLWRAMERTQRSKGGGAGITTEMAALLMFLVGGMVTRGELVLSAATTGVAAVLLHWKAPLHGWVRNLQSADLSAVMRLVLIGLVILPLLPDRTYGPYQVLNPFEIWAMVVLIVGISMAAYVAHRLTGSRVGTVLAGLLGGLISSTATTVSYARRTRGDPAEVPPAALVLILASTAVFARVLFEIGLVAPGAFRATAPPLLAMMGFTGLLALATYSRTRVQLERTAIEHAPSDLRAAIAFGLLYGLVLLGVAAAKETWGAAGLYAVALLSGLTDVDAITLSTAHLIEDGRIEPHLGWRVVLVGVLANLAFKGVVACFLASRALWPWILCLFGLPILAGASLLAFLS